MVNLIEKHSSLYEEKNFNQRAEAIDLIEFQVIDRIGEFLQTTAEPEELPLLRSHADQLRSELEAIDHQLFQKLRAKIRAGECRGEAFRAMIGEYVDRDPDESDLHPGGSDPDPGGGGSDLHPGGSGYSEETGYDNLDVFINGLTLLQAMPEPSKELEPEMVDYHKTPARIVFELAGRLSFREEDVFFDLGSGLGQVTILVNLLTGIRARGVEFEPAYCDYARNCAAALNLSDVGFIHADAREADYSGGTIFFMFTPFREGILREVLEVLRKESLQRKIRIITYGPCTARVASESWLGWVSPGREGDKEYTLAIFSS